jgi:hypothetical protein
MRDPRAPLPFSTAPVTDPAFRPDEPDHFIVKRGNARVRGEELSGRRLEARAGKPR